MFENLTIAYLDPGAGSMLLQALVGGSAGVFVFVRHVLKSWRLNRTAASRSTEQA